MRAGVAAGALCLALGAQAAETPPNQRLEQIERSLGAERETQRRLSRQAEALAQELITLRARAVAMAASLQQTEERLSELEARGAALEADVDAKAASFQRRRAQLAQLVAELARFGRQPPEAALVLPVSPLETVRTAQLLATVTPALRAHAAALADELESLQTARAELEQQRKATSEAAARLAAERSELDALIARRAQLQAETETAQRSSAARLEQLAREVRSVRELIERLAAERAQREAAARAAAENEARERVEREKAAQEKEAQLTRRAAPGAGTLRPFSEANGQVVAPVRGRIVLSFGQPGEGGQPHRGLTIETRPAAQIVAPFDGQIAFAGPFRAYGLILIIEHSEGYHTLLAGLGRIDGVVGQMVTAGEPVGAAVSPEAGSPSVYVELRRNGQPINPLPWLAPRNEKVSG